VNVPPEASKAKSSLKALAAGRPTSCQIVWATHGVSPRESALSNESLCAWNKQRRKVGEIRNGLTDFKVQTFNLQ
jgi:hypothetical protein